ncbi:hypothetical protein ACETU7_34880 [Rhodococcus sp. 3Y1]
MVAGPFSGSEVFGSPGFVVGSPPPGVVISVSVEPDPGVSGVVGFSPPLSPGPRPPPGFASVGSTGGVASVSGSVGHHAGGSGSVIPGMVGQFGWSLSWSAAWLSSRCPGSAQAEVCTDALCTSACRKAASRTGWWDTRTEDTCCRLPKAEDHETE